MDNHAWEALLPWLAVRDAAAPDNLAAMLATVTVTADTALLRALLSQFKTKQPFTYPPPVLRVWIQVYQVLAQALGSGIMMAVTPSLQSPHLPCTDYLHFFF